MSIRDDIRDLMARYPSDLDRSAVSLDDLLSRDPRPDGTAIAAAAIGAVLAGFSPAEQAEALDALAADLADGGSIQVAVTDREDRR